MAMDNDTTVGRLDRPERIVPPWLYAAALRHAYSHLLPSRHYVVGVDGVKQVGCGVAGSRDFRRIIVTLH